MKQRKQYTKEFKQGAIRLVTEQGRSISGAASSLGIPSWSLSRWVSSAKKEGQDASRGNGKRSAQEQEIFEYIEVFYNRSRIHSASEYLCPVEYEERFKRAA